MTQAVMVARRIVQHQGICAGAPILEGTRIRVSDLVVEYEYKKRSVDEIIEDFPSLTMADVHRALVYYHEHPAEIRAEIAERRRTFQEAQRQHGHNSS